MAYRQGAPVLGERNNLLGVLTLADIQRVPPSEREQRRVAQAMNRNVLVVSPDETLEQLTSHRVSWAPVVDVEALPERRHVVELLKA